MKKLLPLLLLSIFSSYSYEYHTNFCGGLSLMTAELSSAMRPGPSLSLEPNFKLNENFGIGGHADYSWLTFKTGSTKYKAGFHLIDIGFVPKAYINLNSESSMFFEVDPAFTAMIFYERGPYYGDSNFESFFGMTFGTGFLLKNLIFGFKFKTVFTDYYNFKYVNFYVGYSGS